MEAPSAPHLEAPGTIELHPSAPTSQSRRRSLTPSARRERPPLRSSPLAGPSYAADGVGNVIQHGSALGEEIARRRSQLHAGLNDEELARLAALSDSIPMPSTPSASISTDALPSSQGSSDASDHSLNPPPPRRARPSFISLAPPSPGAISPGATSPNSHNIPAQPLSPPPLRSRHSSPNMARTASLPNAAGAPFPPRDHVTGKPAGHWMAAAPTSAFSRNAIHASGVVLPVKASSRSGQRIRRKSMPAKPSHGSSKPSSPTSKPPSPTAMTQRPASSDGKQEATQQTFSPKKSIRSMRSLKSISRMFKADEEQSPPGHEEATPPVPALPSPLPLSRASSVSGLSSAGGPPTPTQVSTPSSPGVVKSGHLQALNPSATQSKLSVDETSAAQTEPSADAGGKEAGTGRVRKLWAKVMSGVRKRERA